MSKSESWFQGKEKLAFNTCCFRFSPRAASAGISSQSLLKDILVIIEVFPFGLFRTDDLVANLYGICLEEKLIF